MPSSPYNSKVYPKRGASSGSNPETNQNARAVGNRFDNFVKKDPASISARKKYADPTERPFPIIQRDAANGDWLAQRYMLIKAIPRLGSLFTRYFKGFWKPVMHLNYEDAFMHFMDIITSGMVRWNKNNENPGAVGSENKIGTFANFDLNKVGGGAIRDVWAAWAVHFAKQVEGLCKDDRKKVMRGIKKGTYSDNDTYGYEELRASGENGEDEYDPGKKSGAIRDVEKEKIVQEFFDWMKKKLQSPEYRQLRGSYETLCKAFYLAWLQRYSLKDIGEHMGLHRQQIDRIFKYLGELAKKFQVEVGGFEPDDEEYGA